MSSSASSERFWRFTSTAEPPSPSFPSRTGGAKPARLKRRSKPDGATDLWPYGQRPPRRIGGYPSAHLVSPPLASRNITLDPRHLFQRYWETKQKKLTLSLTPVAENYSQQPYPRGRTGRPRRHDAHWASSLPVLLPEGVGDDSDIIEREGGGAIFNLDRLVSVSEALANVAQQMAHPGYRQRVRHLAERHRSIELSRQAYTHFFGVPALQ